MCCFGHRVHLMEKVIVIYHGMTAGILHYCALGPAYLVKLIGNWKVWQVFSIVGRNTNLYKFKASVEVEDLDDGSTDVYLKSHNSYLASIESLIVTVPLGDRYLQLYN